LEAGADAKTGCVYCSECGNFIYDSALNNVFVSTTLNAEEKHTRFQGLASGSRNFSVVDAKKF
jgi:ubiquitin carboxyl-terminal hydrolase 22/27/51